jgi:aspartate/methionine/tyrosine aminotransferase
MFSRRTEWDLSRNRLADALRHRRRSGQQVFDLTESNPTRCGLSVEAGILRAAISRPEITLYEPEPFGPLAVRDAIVDAYGLRRHGVAGDQVVLTCSTSESYSHLFRLLADAGDRILVPQPSYPLFPYLARLDQLEVDPYPLNVDDLFRIDLDALTAAVQPRTRAVLLIHPGNPTGAFINNEDIDRLREICRRYQLALISDEVFSDFAYRDDRRRPSTLAGSDDVLTFCLNGLSKSIGLPQLKVGWIAVTGPPDLRDTALTRLEIICDTYLSVNTPALVAMPSLLENKAAATGKILERVLENRALLTEALGADDIARCLPAEGGWSAILQVPGIRTEEEWCLRILDETGVLVHPGYFFDFPRPGYLVASLLPDPARFREAAGRLAGAIAAAASTGS